VWTQAPQQSSADVARDEGVDEAGERGSTGQTELIGQDQGIRVHALEVSGDLERSIGHRLPVVGLATDAKKTVGSLATCQASMAGSFLYTTPETVFLGFNT
jgi:hypothetical protein